MSTFDQINAGKYENALPFARRKDNPEAWDAYQKETSRLHQLFTDDLLTHLGMDPGPAFDALFRYAWEEGHAHGFSEVAAIADDLVDLLKAGSAEERARIRQEVTAAINSLTFDGTVGLPPRRQMLIRKHELADALDRIFQGPAE